MRVKRYIVDSMPDALQQIRSELGKEAVILNTKELRHGGILGWFGKKKIEVIAAIDGQQGAKTKLTEPAPVAAAQASVQAAVQTATLTPTIPSKKEATNDRLADEIKQMKEMVVQLARQQQTNRELPQPLHALRERLLAHEVAPDHVEQLLANTLTAINDDVRLHDEEIVRDALKAEIRNWLKEERVVGIQDDTKIVHFVGPTGVGKTTTIAKLAAEQVLKKKRKVGFITSDTYRISAVEQLKTYATILNVPVEVVVSPIELNRAFERLEHCDIIFMDTAGRNFRNEMYVSELNSLLQASGKSETILVLSLTTRYRDMKVITYNFSRFKLDKVLFTKRDETDSYGAILNIAMDFPLSLSYITDGQNVPDDIGIMDTEEWIERLLEVNEHE